ncbi:DUF4397 domain-containing protein [Flaviaesturariibacter amylovorans]|uniref:DUF4397 domain-containing protein n=1 Tax=Flaviaesturariibacter amylovorans TaxID=1084520 RepID=A0ABP8HU39_9BACT
MRSFLKTALGVLLLSLPFASCDKDDDDDDDTPAAGNARVNVVHASPNGPNVDVRVNNAVALSNVAYGAASGYQTVTAGNTNIKVSPTGTTTYVIDANVNLAANMSYSVFAVDSVSRIKAAVVGDDLTAPAAGKAHVRFLHFSPNAPAVDIAVTGGAVLFANRSFNDQATNAAVTGFTSVNAGTYNLEVRLAGQSAAALALPPVTLESGKIYTVYAKGFLGGTGAQALGAGMFTHN